MDDEGNIAVMEVLQPHPNLKKLVVLNYQGTRMPDWASYHLPNLVQLELYYCKMLKGWRRGRGGAEDGSRSGNNNEPQMQSCLPHLKSLYIDNCRELTWIPLCPKLEILYLENFNKRMVIGEGGPASTSWKEVGNSCCKLKDIRIDKVPCLMNALPMEAFQCLESLEIYRDDEVEKLGEVGEVFRSCSSSLRSLSIINCKKLRRVVGGGGLEHLTALEKLVLSYCGNLKLSEEEEEKEGEDVGIMPCPSLLPSLRTLTLSNLPKLEYLPNWMQFLPALQTLKIEGCHKLKAMPNWMTKLTSLSDLHV